MVRIGLVFVVLLLIVVGWLSLGGDEATRFFEASDVRVVFNEEEGAWHLRLVTPEPVLCQIHLGPADAEAEGFTAMHRRTAVRDALTRPAKDHRVELLALRPETSYTLNVVLVDEEARVYRSEDLAFETTARAETPGAWEPDGENLALLQKGGRVVGVSSNWAGGDNDSAFGANNAIDGDPNTEWSSDGDGDEAWIEIALAEEGTITGVGFWTRTMGTSAQIYKFRVLALDGTVLGVFDLPDAKQLYNFDLEDFVGKQLRFEAVESSGGNTGAEEIAIYVKQD